MLRYTITCDHRECPTVSHHSSDLLSLQRELEVAGWSFVADPNPDPNPERRRRVANPFIFKAYCPLHRPP